MSSLFDFDRFSLEKELELAQVTQNPCFQARAIFKNIYKMEKDTHSFCSGLSKKIGVWMRQNPLLAKPPAEIASTHWSSSDSSVKLLIRLTKDASLIESVLIPEKGRLTLCLSTQVGCAQACRFCQTGRMGLTRHLTTGEIVFQVLLAEHWRKTQTELAVSHYGRVSNLVYMGMGEPLDNIEHVIQSTRIFCDNMGLNFSPNKVTVSTVGLQPALGRLLSETQVAVAISLHSPFEEERTRIVPANAGCSLSDIINTLKNYNDFPKKRVFFIQYTMLHEVNDSPAHAAALVSLLQKLPVKINLIPLNEHSGTGYRRPSLARISEFQKALKNAGMVATIRFSKGRDIHAACGQLQTEG